MQAACRAGVGLTRATRGRLSIHSANSNRDLFDAWGRAAPGGTSDVQAAGIFFRKAYASTLRILASPASR